MTLSGEQWLARFFEPVVAAGPSRVLGARLAAQVEALGATGVLTGEQVRDALDVLEEAGVRPEIQSASASTFTSADVPVAVRAGSIAPTPVVEAPPVFRGVLGGPRELGQLDGRPVTLVSVELWSNRILVDLFTDPGQEYRDRRARASRARFERLRHGDPGRPTVVSSPLQSLTWTLSDGNGTVYRQTGGSGTSESRVDRQKTQWSPAPPANTEHVTLRATNATGTVVLNADIPVPAVS